MSSKSELDELRVAGVNFECIVLVVSEDDDHPAAEYVEDEEMTIVQKKDDCEMWWSADEFFDMTNIEEFVITKGEI